MCSVKQTKYDAIVCIVMEYKGVINEWEHDISKVKHTIIFDRSVRLLT